MEPYEKKELQSSTSSHFQFKVSSEEQTPVDSGGKERGSR
jgi:hypothetical protein